MKTAKKVHTMQGWRGEAHVFQLDPPVTFGEYDDDKGEYDDAETQFVIVSAADVPYSGPETYIFPAQKDGDGFTAINMGEMEGSYRGGLDHEEALKGLGYDVQQEA